MHSELYYGLSFAPKLQRVGSIHIPGWDQPTPDPSFSHDNINIGAEILKKVNYICEAAISGPQKGFVPERQITDLYAKKARLVLVLLDMEKVFDGCSWEFLKKAMDKIGLK